jgi:aminoglycoside N3'-acetyltransferase
MGLISEAFRRSPGVVRSVHPTHPVALWGRDAGEWAAGHPLATTPCGRGSPYFRLLECDGDVLLLGARITDLTLFHTLEELLEPRMPVSPFTRERFVFDCRGADGAQVRVETRLFDPELSARRNLRKLAPELKRRGAWSEARVGLLRVVRLPARGISDAAHAMAEQGKYCYDDHQ